MNRDNDDYLQDIIDNMSDDDDQILNAEVVQTPNIRSVSYKPEVDILTDSNVDYIKDYVDRCFTQVYDYLNIHNPKYQVIIHGKNDYSFSTPFNNDYLDVLRDIYRKLDKYADEYDGGRNGYIKISTVEIRFLTNYKIPIGKMFKTIQTANLLWYEPTIRSIDNCVWTSIAVATKHVEFPQYLTDSVKRNKAGANLKARSGLKIDTVTLSDIPTIADKLKLQIHVYNNIYEKILITGSGIKICIKISNNHATPLIPRKDIKTDLLEEKLKSIKTNDECKIIYSKNPDKNIDNRYVAWDIETYVKDNKLVVYCSGLAHYKDYNNTKRIIFKRMYGDDENLINFANYIKENIKTYNNATFYAHNGGNFDVVLLVRDAILNDPDFEIVQNKAIELNGSWIGFSIKYAGCIIHFKDSYRLLLGSLSNLTKDMKLPVQKGNIDHTQINENNYMLKMNEIIEYHKKDCISLLLLVEMFSKSVYDICKINITSCFTAASLSKRMFLTKYYNPKKNNHTVYRLPKNIDNYIRNGYYGGRNECFKIGRVYGPLYYYDFTSLYPFAGTHLLPVGKPVFHDLQNKTIKEALDIVDFGFICCKVTCNKTGIPLHGVKEGGKLLFPQMNNVELTLFTAEIIEGLKHGYTYEPISGYRFIKKSIMKDFFIDGFNNKKKGKDTMNKVLEYFWKIIINSGYGFWGFNPFDKDCIKITAKHSKLWCKYLNENILINTGIIGNYNICRVKTQNINIDSNVAIAAAITSYARIILHEAMTAIKNAGGIIYYVDTDSITTDLCLSDHPHLMEKYRKDGTGGLLGGLKNEYGLNDDNSDCSFESATFVGCKMYSHTVNGEIHSKLKGYTKPDETVISDMNNDIVVSQEQNRLNKTKSDYIRDSDDIWNIKPSVITKRFGKLYTKGNVDINGWVTPLLISH